MTSDGDDRPVEPRGDDPAHDERFRRNPTVLSRALPDGVLLLPPGQDQPIALLGSGGELWAHLARPCSHAELIAYLAHRYDTDPATVEGDVAAVWRQLLALDAVVTA